MANKPSEEYSNFDRTMRELMKVPHEEIKKQLDAEKADKKERKRSPTEEQNKRKES